MRFAQKGVQQLIIKGGESRTEAARLILRNLGPAMSATCRYAFTEIRTVVIRGSIVSAPNVNFRFAVGPFNALCNWEVKPENHFFLGAKRTHSAPPLFQKQTEHELRIRHIGDEVVLFFDDKLAFRGKGELAGTVSVYPSLRSEISVREILIDGDVDPHTRVSGPRRKLW